VGLVLPVQRAEAGLLLVETRVVGRPVTVSYTPDDHIAVAWRSVAQTGWPRPVCLRWYSARSTPTTDDNVGGVAVSEAPPQRQVASLHGPASYSSPAAAGAGSSPPRSDSGASGPYMKLLQQMMSFLTACRVA
jgi:hypothetical protein